MTARTLPLAFAALLLAACAVEPVDPPAPSGTVFPGALGYAGDVSQDAGGGCTDGSCSAASIEPGFRATLQKSGGDVMLDVGPCNPVPPSTCPVNSGTIVVYQQNALDGTDPYNFSFQSVASAGRYRVVSGLEWNPLVTSDAGFTYAEGATGAVRTASSVSGTLDISQVSPRLVGRLTNGKVTLDGAEFSISAEFNVPVQEQ